MPSDLKDRVNSTIRMLFDTTMPAIMMTPISDMTFTVVCVTSRNRITPVMPGGIASRMIRRVFERSKLRHQDQINKNDGQDQADPEALERLPHAFYRAAHGDAYVLRAAWFVR